MYREHGVEKYRAETFEKRKIVPKGTTCKVVAKADVIAEETSVVKRIQIVCNGQKEKYINVISGINKTLLIPGLRVQKCFISEGVCLGPLL